MRNVPERTIRHYYHAMMRGQADRAYLECDDLEAFYRLFRQLHPLATPPIAAARASSFGRPDLAAGVVSVSRNAASDLAHAMEGQASDRRRKYGRLSRVPTSSANVTSFMAPCPSERLHHAALHLASGEEEGEEDFDSRMEEAGLTELCRLQTLQDILTVERRTRPDATLEDLVAAARFYRQYDTFRP